MWKETQVFTRVCKFTLGESKYTYVRSDQVAAIFADECEGVPHTILMLCGRAGNLGVMETVDVVAKELWGT